MTRHRNVNTFPVISQWLLHIIVPVNKYSTAEEKEEEKKGGGGRGEGGRKVSWCFTPNQPVRLYQVEEKNK